MRTQVSGAERAPGMVPCGLSQTLPGAFPEGVGKGAKVADFPDVLSHVQRPSVCAQALALLRDDDL